MADNEIYQEIEQDFKGLGFDFRLNAMDDSIEVYMDDAWKKYDEITEKVITLNMKVLGYGGKKKPSITTMKEGFVLRAYYNRFNPIVDYLKSLDGTYKPQYHDNGDAFPYRIKSMQKYVNNPDGHFSTWLFKWMVGAIAKVFEGERNPMLVLSGGQNIGKSYMAKWLCPLPDHFVKGGIESDSKDHKFRLVTGFIWEVDELASTTTRQDSNSLKSFLTLNKVYERKSYGYNAKSWDVNCSFIGTANFDGAGFLNDPTGTTRFLTCEIDYIDFGYSKSLSPHDLWAEAYWFYNNVPNCYKLSNEQKAKRDEMNAQFEVQSALEDVILTLFYIDKNNGEWFSTTQEIKNKCYGSYRITNEQGFYNELARVLTKLGLKKTRSGSIRGWKGISHKAMSGIYEK